MAEEIYRRVAERLQELKGKVESLIRRELSSEVRKLWRIYGPAANPPEGIVGVDGGSAFQEFQGFTLYVATATAVTYRRVGGRFEAGRTYRVSEVDILTLPEAADRVRTYREIMEGKVALSALILEEPEIVLIDGSIKSLLITPPRIRERLFRDALDKARAKFGLKILNEVFERVMEQVRNPESLRRDPVVTTSLIKDEYLDEDNLPEVLALENFEKLITYRALFQNANFHGIPVVFVSKTSRSQTYAKKYLKRLGRASLPSDITLFQYLTESPGYSRPEGEDKPIKTLPEHFKLNEFIRDLRIVTTYVRLREGHPVLKVEIPVLDSLRKAPTEEAVRDLMDYLKSVEVNGYPHPLLEAHELSKISREEVVNVVRLLNLGVFLTGREVLGSWMS